MDQKPQQKAQNEGSQLSVIQELSQNTENQQYSQPPQDPMTGVFGNRQNVFANFNRQSEPQESDDEDFSGENSDEDEDDDALADLVDDEEESNGIDLDDYLKNRDKL